MPSYFYPEPSATTFVPSLDWEEAYEGLNQPGGGATFSRDGGEAVLVGSIPYEKMRSARNSILGYAYADSASPWALHRVPPWRHPIFPEQRASDVHFIGYNPEGVTGNPGNKPYISSAVPADTLTRFMRYTRATTTVRFKPYPYLFLTDTELGGNSERTRNCTVFDTLDPSLELLMADTQPFMKFIEGITGTTFPAPLPEYVTKCLFVMAWYDVPYEFVANPYLPSKIMQCVGRVNTTDDWLNGGVTGAGFPRGTLLLEAPRIRKKIQPMWTIADRSPFLVDIYLPFKFVNPTPALGVGSSYYRGWNLLPFSRVGDSNGALWYSAGRGGSVSAPLFPFANFDAMFTHVSGPVTP